MVLFAQVIRAMPPRIPTAPVIVTTRRYERTKQQRSAGVRARLAAKLEDPEMCLRKWLVSGALAPMALVAGCMLDYLPDREHVGPGPAVSDWALLQVREGLWPTLRDRFGADVEREMRILVSVRSGEEMLTYPVGEAIQDAGEFVVGSSINDAGQLAIVNFNGLVGIVTLGADQFEMQRALGAVAAAWSNDGSRIAVLTQNAAAPEGNRHKLLVLSPSLDTTLSETALDLPVLHLDPRPFRLSWSSDDAQLAASINGAAVDSLTTPPVTLVLDMVDGSIDRYSLASVFFVDSTSVIATATPYPIFIGEDRVDRMRLNDGRIEGSTRVRNAFWSSASYPKARVYAVARLPRALAFHSLPVDLIDESGRSSTHVGSDDRSTPVMLIPRSVVDRFVEF